MMAEKAAMRTARIDLLHASLPVGSDLDDRRKACFLAAGSGRALLRIRLPSDAPMSIVGAYDDAVAAPGIIAQALAAERDGAMALVINCTADTGLAAAREAVAIPVVGVAQAAFHVAAQLGRTFSILTFSERVAGRLKDQLKGYGLLDRLASIRVVDLSLDELPGVDDLAAELTEAARSCFIDDRADVVILGCTDFELAASDIRRRLAASGLDLPVVCPLDAAVWFAEALVSMGLSQSPATYPRSSATPIASSYPSRTNSGATSD